MQVAAAVGVPVQRGKVAELTLLRRAVGGEGMALFPLPGASAFDTCVALLFLSRKSQCAYPLSSVRMRSV